MYGINYLDEMGFEVKYPLEELGGVWIVKKDNGDKVFWFSGEEMKKHPTAETTKEYLISNLTAK